MERKYTVEMEMSDETIVKIEANPAGLKIDDFVQMRIETALFPLCGKAILIYRADEGKKLIDLFQTCPVCAHSWTLHFSMVEAKPVSMSDGSVGTRGVLTDPVPTNCSECASQKQICLEASKHK